MHRDAAVASIRDTGCRSIRRGIEEVRCRSSSSCSRARSGRGTSCARRRRHLRRRKARTRVIDLSLSEDHNEGVMIMWYGSDPETYPSITPRCDRSRLRCRMGGAHVLAWNRDDASRLRPVCLSRRAVGSQWMQAREGLLPRTHTTSTSPDGRYYAFVRQHLNPDPPDDHLYIAARPGAPRHVMALAPDADWCRTILWTPDSRTVGFLINEQRLALFDVRRMALISTVTLVNADGYPGSEEGPPRIDRQRRHRSPSNTSSGQRCCCPPKRPGSSRCR